ncbi:MAG: hypothetical protein Kow0098_16620 [Ignavibacteriaceae bacterium]
MHVRSIISRFDNANERIRMKNIRILLTGIMMTLPFSFICGQNLGPGDGVRITFFNISDKISGDYYVQQDYMLQLPYIGLINTNNKPFPLIRQEIHQKYDSLYKNPELTVQPLFRINVLGEVRSPGLYYVTDVEKLSSIFALAGGITGEADIDNVYIVRNDKEIQIDAGAMIATESTVSELGLQSGDRIYVPRTWWADARGITIIASSVAVLVTVIALFIR